MKRTVWILGQGGLLGSAARHQYERSAENTIFTPTTPLVWGAENIGEAIRTATCAFAEAARGGAWELVWAAGQGTMASTDDELKRETAIVEILLAAIAGEASLQKEAGTVLFASSAGGIYADATHDVITESTPPSPTSAYGHTKLRQEEMLRAWSASKPNITILVARFSTLYGSGQSTTKRQGLLTHIARCILRRQPINIFVPFDTIRDYLHVDDAAAIAVTALASFRGSGGYHMKIIASEEPATIATIIATYRRIARTNPRIITSANPAGAAYRHRISFRSNTGTPTVHRSLTVGIAELMEHERQRFASVSRVDLD